MKRFIAKLEFRYGNPKVIKVSANNVSDVVKFIKKNHQNVVYERIEEEIDCFVESSFGHIHIDAEPNPYYDNEVIINDRRFSLPMFINYWDIKSICFNSVQNNSIAVIRTKKDTYITKIRSDIHSSSLECIANIK